MLFKIYHIHVLTIQKAQTYMPKHSILTPKSAPTKANTSYEHIICNTYVSEVNLTNINMHFEIQLVHQLSNTLIIIP